MGIRFDDLEPGDFQPTSIDGGLAKLVRIWEHLRDLNTGGYGGAVLTDVKNATSKGKSGVTSCSPFTATCIYLALDPRPFDPGSPWSPREPYEPVFDGGKPLGANFYQLHNSFGLSTYASLKDNRFAGWKADFKQRFVDHVPQLARDFSAFQFINHSAGSVIAFNLGKPVEPKRMRRGDVVGIDWHNGHGHATFCWNVHLNAQGEVDCFQFISSNGTAAGGAGITIFRYPDVDPAYLEKSGGKYKKKKDMFSGIIDDPRAYPEYIQKPYWWFGLPGVKKGQIDLDSFGVPAKSVQISYADSMDVSVSVVHVSRLHGITAPEPYLRADGGKTPEPEEDSKPAPLAKARAKKAEAAPQGAAGQGAVEKAPPAPPHPVQEELEGHLQALWKARWISKDPGDPGSVNDPESQAAIRSYQETFMKGDAPQLGHADPKTRARIAKAAASAEAMPMVNAALHLAFEHGEIKSAPGADPILDDATRAAVKEFQKKKGLDPDGIPGPLTQEKLSAYMKEAAKSAPAENPPPQPDQQGANSKTPEGLAVWYFPRNHGPGDKPITVSVKVLPAGAFDGKSYSVTLLSKDGKELAKDAGKITIQDGKGSVEIPLPDAAGPGSVLKAKVSGDGTALDVWGEYTVDAGEKPPIFELVPNPWAWMDSHGSDLANDDTFSRKDKTRPQVAFVEGEHLELGQSMTQTVDTWALAGLIEGGAMIDVKEKNHLPGPLDTWEIHLPMEGPADMPEAPYESGGDLKSSHWHYIVPDPVYQDPVKKYRWTKEGLYYALQRGEAAVIAFGQLVFVGGDWVGSFEDLHKPFLFKPPKNVMEAADKGTPLALVVLDVLQNPGAHAFFDIRDLQIAAGSDKWTARVTPNVNVLMEAAEEVRSAPFGPLQLITHFMASRQFPLPWKALEPHVPWIKTGNLAMETLRGLNIVEEVLGALLTNGAFLDLAYHNEPHFTPGNWAAFQSGFSKALSELQAHLGKRHAGQPPAPIPASVLGRVGFSLHFLTDAFSSAHMRVPRAALGTNGSIASKVMHDIDGNLGLVVTNDFKDKWRAYGDGYLHPFREARGPGVPSKEQIQKLHDKFKAGQPSATDSNVEANYQHVTALVSEAVLLVHYEAQRLRTAGKAAAFPRLDKMRGVGGGGFLGDKYAPTGPHFPSAADWLHKSVDEKVAYLKKHLPKPVAPGTDAGANHAPLFDVGRATFNSSGNYSHEKNSHSVVRATTKVRADEHSIVVSFASERYTFDVSQFFHIAQLMSAAKVPGVPQETVLLKLLGDHGLPKA